MRSSANVLLLVENNAYPFDVRVRREALALRSAGFRVFVISPRGKGQSWTETVHGVEVYRFPAPPGGSGLIGYAFEFGYATLAMFLLTCWIAVRHGIDVIHAANPPDTLFVIGAVFKPFGKRFVFDHHDLAPETYLSRFGRPTENAVSRVLRLLERYCYATADVVIGTNESYRELAIQRGGKRPEQVFVVRNGPPLSFQPIAPDPALAARARYLIGYVGTMGPQDGVDYWLRAIQKMIVELGRRDFLAVIIGDGDAAPSLRQLARDLDIESYVWFTGRISDHDLKAYLSTVHVCVHPDPLNPLNDRSTMNKMMEYMAFGKPTVSFDLREARFSAQGAATYAQPNDELDFARKVCALLDDPIERERMGRVGQERVARYLAWEYSVPELLRSYREGLGLAPLQPTIGQRSDAHADRAI
ncbi:MAG: glycosyltransferase family 4 protein [Steroidobacteraceae bacterium]